MEFHVECHRHFVKNDKGESFPVTIRYMYLTGTDPLLGDVTLRVVKMGRRDSFSIRSTTKTATTKWPEMKLVPDVEYVWDNGVDEPTLDFPHPVERFDGEQFKKWLSYRLGDRAGVALAMMLLCEPKR